MTYVPHDMQRIENWENFSTGVGYNYMDYIYASEEITRYVGELLEKCRSFEELKTELLHFHQDRTAFIDHATRNIPGEEMPAPA